MSILTIIREPLAKGVVISDSALRIVLADGRGISAAGLVPAVGASDGDRTE